MKMYIWTDADVENVFIYLSQMARFESALSYFDKVYEVPVTWVVSSKI